MLKLALIVSLGAIKVAYVLLRTRVMPKAVVKVWFGGVLAMVLILSAVGTFMIDLLRLVGVPRPTVQNLCSRLCSYTFGLALLLNPQIRTHVDESEVRWADIPTRSVMFINHVSFLDVFVFVGVCPTSYIYNCRTFMKDALRKTPIFGPVYDRVGHFPVFFRSDADGNFGVDKERQAEVQGRVVEHLQRNGRLALFPEGQVNKTPAELLPFRIGSFGIASEHKLPMYYCLTMGNDHVWSGSGKVIGGPADIRIKIGRIDPVEGEDAPTLAARAQTIMQAELTNLRQAKKKD